MQKYGIRLMGKDLSVEIDESEQLDIAAIVESLNRQWNDIKERNVDTQKAAALMSFNLAKELFQFKNKQKETLESDRKKMQRLINQIDETIS